MNVVIRNYLAGSYLLENEPDAWDAIVVLDSDVEATGFLAEHSRRSLSLRFDDVATAMPGKVTPSSSAVAQAIEFADDAENLLVCCRAGQSRSAALAFLICYQWIGRDAAWGVLNPKRHIPNPLVVELGAKLLGELPIWKDFQSWRSLNRGVVLADYYDEIEAEFDELEALGARNRLIRE